MFEYKLSVILRNPVKLQLFVPAVITCSFRLINENGLIDGVWSLDLEGGMGKSMNQDRMC